MVGDIDVGVVRAWADRLRLPVQDLEVEAVPLVLCAAEAWVVNVKEAKVATAIGVASLLPVLGDCVNLVRALSQGESDLSSDIVAIPIHRGHCLLLEEGTDPCRDRWHRLKYAGGERVFRVRDHEEVLGLRQVVPPVVGVVGLLELVADRVDDQLWHGEAIEVEVGILNLLEFEHVRVVEAFGDVHVVVVLQGDGPAAVRTVLMVREFNEVGGVEHNRHGRHHAPWVDGAHQPGGPAALGRAGDGVVIELHVESKVVGGVSRDGIHGAEYALDHRQPHQPLRLVRVAKEVVPRESDNCVFGPALLQGVAREDHVLVGHLKERARDGARVHGESGGHSEVLVRGRRGRRAGVRATGDIKGSVVLVLLGVQVGRDDDHEVVEPDRPVDVIVGEPLL
mmetsp:Transcript_35721/g.95836  ORF Transcript_35721/g.95836 Transcript_35721/m.95836 type:complete len:394 (+) Transcript_35721:476-1657(+)